MVCRLNSLNIQTLFLSAPTIVIISWRHCHARSGGLDIPFLFKKSKWTSFDVAQKIFNGEMDNDVSKEGHSGTQLWDKGNIYRSLKDWMFYLWLKCCSFSFEISSYESQTRSAKQSDATLSDYPWTYVYKEETDNRKMILQFCFSPTHCIQTRCTVSEKSKLNSKATSSHLLNT